MGLCGQQNLCHSRRPPAPVSIGVFQLAEPHQLRYSQYADYGRSLWHDSYHISLAPNPIRPETPLLTLLHVAWGHLQRWPFIDSARSNEQIVLTAVLYLFGESVCLRRTLFLFLRPLAGNLTLAESTLADKLRVLPCFSRNCNSLTIFRINTYGYVAY